MAVSSKCGKVSAEAPAGLISRIHEVRKLSYAIIEVLGQRCAQAQEQDNCLMAEPSWEIIGTITQAEQYLDELRGDLSVILDVVQVVRDRLDN